MFNKLIKAARKTKEQEDHRQAYAPKRQPLKKYKGGMAKYNPETDTYDYI